MMPMSVTLTMVVSAMIAVVIQCGGRHNRD